MFNYNDKVEVVGGFYTGQTGYVKRKINWFFLYTTYKISPYDIAGYLTISEKHLKLIKRNNK